MAERERAIGAHNRFMTTLFVKQQIARLQQSRFDHRLEGNPRLAALGGLGQGPAAEDLALGEHHQGPIRDIVFACDSWAELKHIDMTASCTNPFVQIYPKTPLKRIFDTRSDYEVLAGGANLSLGQRQLLALARDETREERLRLEPEPLARDVVVRQVRVDRQVDLHLGVLVRRVAAELWKARAELSGDWFWQTDAEHRFNGVYRHR